MFLLSISLPNIFWSCSFSLLRIYTAVCEESSWWQALILLCSNYLSLSSLTVTISWYCLLILSNYSVYCICFCHSWLYFDSDSSTVLLSSLTSESCISSYFLILAIISSFSLRVFLVKSIYLLALSRLICIYVMAELWWEPWAERTFFTSSNWLNNVVF